MLDYSRVEAGAVTYRLEHIPIAEAVAEAEVLVAPQLTIMASDMTTPAASPASAPAR